MVRTMTPYGIFLVCNKEESNKARIIVKIRPYNIDTLPLSIVVLHNNNDKGAGDSWTCPTFIISRTMLGDEGGDEDPIPPSDVSPHPMPMGFDDIWAGGHGHGNVHGQAPQVQVQQEMVNEAAGMAHDDPIQIDADVPDLNLPVTPP